VHGQTTTYDGSRTFFSRASAHVACPTHGSAERTGAETASVFRDSWDARPSDEGDVSFERRDAATMASRRPSAMSSVLFMPLPGTPPMDLSRPGIVALSNSVTRLAFFFTDMTLSVSLASLSSPDDSSLASLSQSLSERGMFSFFFS